MPRLRLLSALSVLFVCLFFAGYPSSQSFAEEAAGTPEVKKLDVVTGDTAQADKKTEPKAEKKSDAEEQVKTDKEEKQQQKEAVKPAEPDADADKKAEPAKTETPDKKTETKDGVKADEKTSDTSDEKNAEKQQSPAHPKVTTNDYSPAGKYPSSISPWLAEIGLNNPEFNGLLYNFWYKSEASTLTGFMDKFEPTSTSPTIRSMMIEALTSVTRSPLFTDKNPMQEDINFMKARLRALIRLGAYDEAAQLYQAVIKFRPKKAPIPEELASVGIDAMSLTGATDAACLEANLIAQSIPTVSILEDKALCLLHWNRTAQADELYKFLAEKTDNFKKRKEFASVYSALLNKTYNENTVASTLPPLWNSILLSKNIPVDEGRVYKTKNRIFLGMLARHPAIPETTRALATSLAAERGMMNIDKIRTTYMNTKYDEAVIDSVSDADGANTKRQDVLYNAARNSYSPQKKLSLMKRGLSLIKDRTSVPAYLWADLERELSYNAMKYAGHATEARSRLFAQSMTNYAEAWVKNITEDKKNPQPFTDEINVLLQNYFDGGIIDDKNLNKWVDAMLEKFEKSGEDRVLKSLIVLDFEKNPITDDIWKRVGGKPDSDKEFDFGPDIIDIKNGESYGKFDKGEIYLAGLAYFSHNGLDGIKPEELYSFMSLFGKFGLSDKNMKIGLEILSQSVL